MGDSMNRGPVAPKDPAKKVEIRMKEGHEDKKFTILGFGIA